MFLTGSLALWALGACPWVGLGQEPAAPAPAEPAPAPAPAPAVAAPVVYQSLSVYPPSIKISAQNDLQHIVAVATRADGITVDVTDQVQWKLENPAVAKLENLVLYPLADGATQLVGTWNGMETRSALEITQSQTARKVEFERDIMPIFTKVGCNTGSCHGAARGKDGFRLSLFGFDPLGDYQRITREIGIRRINLAVPEQSLLLLKATGSRYSIPGARRSSPGASITKLFWRGFRQVLLPMLLGPLR